MKPCTTSQLAWTFAGCFLGAGFVSGQELWQFFGCFGVWALPALLLSIGIMAALGIILLRLAQATGIEELDRIVIRRDIPWLRKLCAVLQVVFLFGIVTIMIAATGALITQLTGLPSWIGGLAMTILVAAVAVFGLQGVVRVFSTVVPIIVAATLIISVIAFRHFGADAFQLSAEGSVNPLLPFWFVSAPTYAASNFFGSIGILTPFGKAVPNRRTVVSGILFGGLVLLSIAGSILAALCLHPAAVNAELPMLALSCAISMPLGYVYGILLLFGLFGTTCSCLVAVITFLGFRNPTFAAHKTAGTAVLSLLGFAASLFGFGNLVSTVYPIFGYTGTLFLIGIVLHYLHVKRATRTEAAS